MRLFVDEVIARQIIDRCYTELLNRNPDKKGLEYYLWLIENGHMNEDGLRSDIKNSSEYHVREWFSNEWKKIQKITSIEK